jgi:adenosylhomocysteine nucleosidase
LIGIIGAMPKEISGIIALISLRQMEQVGHIEFYCGKLYGIDVVVGCSGIGKVNAAIAAQAMLMRFQPRVLVNCGVAGGVAAEVAVGDIVVASQVAQYDLDTSAFGDPVGLVPGLNAVLLGCNKKISSEFLRVAAKLVSSRNKARLGVVATGDRFLSDRACGSRICEDFGALAVDMESGSIGHVCAINGIEFGVVRAISDSVYVDSVHCYRGLVDGAADVAAKVVIDSFKNL